MKPNVIMPQHGAKFFKLVMLLSLLFVLLYNMMSLHPLGAEGNINRQDDKFCKDVLRIKDDTVIFLLLTDDAFNSLVTEDNIPEDQLIEVISDFRFYAKAISTKLEQYEISVKFGSWKKIRFELAEGNVEEIETNPKVVCGMVLYAKGRTPTLTSTPTPDYFSIAEIISDYFHIKIRACPKVT